MSLKVKEAKIINILHKMSINNRMSPWILTNAALLA